MGRNVLILLLAFGLVWSVSGRTRYAEFAVVLDAPAVARKIASRQELNSPEALSSLRDIQSAQAAVRRQLEQRKIRVTGSAQLLVNAIFVRIPYESAAELRTIPGVSRVLYMPPMRKHLDRAVQLIQAPGAWNALGGSDNAGAGVKIGIIDTGIDQNHPAFQDSSLNLPSGFPKGETAFTNRKVIVARSYVADLAGGGPEISHPDDLSPRDRSGHGTAVAMIAAGARNTGPVATIMGVAPKAQLGNYKVFGSPGINDFTLASIIIRALEDAYRDGMDIVTLGLGTNPAVYGPLDRDPSCAGGATGTIFQVPADACDVRAQAVEAAVKNGLTVVTSAGDDGTLGNQFPTLNVTSTPGSAPSGITVGSSTNSHVLYASVQVQPPDVPSNLANINALFGDGPKPLGTIGGPLRDVARTGDNGRACSALPAGSLNGAVALLQRGDCTFTAKVTNAQRAGSIAVVMYQSDGSDFLFSPQGLSATAIPTVLIGNTSGVALKNLLQSNPERAVVLNPSLHAEEDTANLVADFSSRGPNIGDYGIKPEVVAVGTNLYTATQKLDPNAELFSLSGYTGVSGSSFAVPQVAGAAALVKQKYAALKPGQIKSAVVNTATTDVNDDFGQARVTAVGAGKLNVAAAVATPATVEPATLSFGLIEQGTLPVSRTLTVTNIGSASATFSIGVSQRDADNAAQVTVTPSSLTLSPGQSNTVNVQLRGSRPAAKSYEGAITIASGSTTLRVPYLYVVGDAVSYNIFPIINGNFTGVVNDQNWLIGFKVVDQYGAPVRNAPVQFRVDSGGGSISQGDNATDRLGIAAANVNLGPTLGDQVFLAIVQGLTVEFDAFARNLPRINSNGVVNGASFQVGKGIAPGSHATIRGTALSDASKEFQTPYLPLSLAGVSVSFDVPSAGISVPARLSYVSEGQINVQVPWELKGQTSAQMKVSLGDISSAVYNVPINDYSPAGFEYDDPASGQRLVAALDQNNKLVSGSNPVPRGQVLQIYANGLGPVTNQPPSGEPSPSAEPSVVVPTVTIGGRPAAVQFSGLAPYFVGLYQINVVVPGEAPTGIQPVVISVGGVDSKTVNVPVM